MKTMDLMDMSLILGENFHLTSLRLLFHCHVHINTCGFEVTDQMENYSNNTCLLSVVVKSNDKDQVCRL